MAQPTTSALAGDVRLRAVLTSDLPVFFEQQLDPDANWMAAFTAENPADRAAFMIHWSGVLADNTITVRTILFDGEVAGHVLQFDRMGYPEVGYWLGKAFWGKGVATRALSQFLKHIRARPLYARAAKDNVASLRVLAKCGFAICGEDSAFSDARGVDVDEFVLRLDARPAAE
jgi:RimJ/RimL family protein N-acetyltransferase